MEEFRFEKTSISSSSLSTTRMDFESEFSRKLHRLERRAKVFFKVSRAFRKYTVLGRGNTIPEPRKKKKADLRAANSFHDKQQRHVAVLKIWYKYEQSCKPAKERLVKCAAARSITR